MDAFPEFLIDLTAGADTRAVAGLVINNAEGKVIHARTRGLPGDVDMRVAQWFARKYGIKHYPIGPANFNPANAGKALSHLARISCGLANGRSVFLAGKRTELPDVPRFSGHNAGYHKGFYYGRPYVPDGSYFNGMNVEAHLWKRITAGTSRVYVEDLENRLRERFEEVLAEMPALAGGKSDILDLFFAYERMGRHSAWNSGIRSSRTVGRICLFEFPWLQKEASRFPAPISQNWLLHRTLIGQFVPGSYSRLINDRLSLPLFDHPRLGKLLKKSLEARKLFRRNIDIPAKRQQQEVMNRTITAMIEHSRDTILSSDSLVNELGYSIVFESLLGDNLKPDNQLAIMLGHSLVMEAWYEQIKRAAEIHRHATA